MCGSVYSYILSILHYVPNTFSALPNLLNRRILEIPYVEVSSRHYSSIYARMPENVDVYLIFAYSPRIGVCAVPLLKY